MKKKKITNKIQGKGKGGKKWVRVFAPEDPWWGSWAEALGGAHWVRGPGEGTLGRDP